MIGDKNDSVSAQSLDGQLLGLFIFVSVDKREAYFPILGPLRWSGNSASDVARINDETCPLHCFSLIIRLHGAHSTCWATVIVR